MKSKISSLSKSQDFKSILSGKKISSKHLTIFFKKLSDKSNKKLNIGFITKKKIGNAVKRNKAKRRMRVLTQKFLKPLAKKNTDSLSLGKILWTRRKKRKLN